MKTILVALVLTIGINIIAQKYGRLIRENSIDLSKNEDFVWRSDNAREVNSE